MKEIFSPLPYLSISFRKLIIRSLHLFEMDVSLFKSKISLLPALLPRNAFREGHGYISVNCGHQVTMVSGLPVPVKVGSDI